MRVLACTQPGLGHLNPMAPFLQALRARGHDVTIASSAKMSGTVAALGFKHLGVGINWVESELDEVFPGVRERAGGLFVVHDVFLNATARAALPDLTAYVEENRPDVIVRGQMEFASCVVAHQQGIPFVTCNPNLLNKRVVDSYFTPPLEALMGQPLPGAYAFLHGRAPSVTLAPNHFLLRGEAFPPKTTLFRWAHESKPRIAGDRPLIHVSLGTVVSREQAHTTVLSGLSTLDGDIVVAGRESRMPATTGLASVTYESFVDHSVLLPRVDVFVHHGGIGSVLSALEHQVPSVILPGWADQDRNARACARLGIAVRLSPRRQKPKRIGAAVKAMLGPKPKSAFARISREAESRPCISEFPSWLENRIA